MTINHADFLQWICFSQQWLEDYNGLLLIKDFGQQWQSNLKMDDQIENTVIDVCGWTCNGLQNLQEIMVVRIYKLKLR